MTRYAIYFLPEPSSCLHRLASAWLGRDAWSNSPIAQPEIAGMAPERVRQITAGPRHYGFHATLKAPFGMADGCSVAALHEAAMAFASARTAFGVRLEIGVLDGFVALLPSEASPALDQLAADCVVAFEPFRAPLDDHDLARRRAAGLSPRAEAYLVRWGYPWVMELFRFHMTLTDRLVEPERSFVVGALSDRLGPGIANPVPIDSITIVAQPDRTSPFAVVRRFPFVD